MITVSKDAIMYKDSEGNMQSAGVLCNVGTFGVDWLEYITGLRGLFESSVFPTDTDLVLNLKNPITNDLYGTFNGVKNLKRVSINGVFKTENTITLTYLAYNSSLEEIDLSGLSHLKVGNAQDAFRNCTLLKVIRGIFDFTNATVVSSFLANCKLLEEIRIKEMSLSKSFSAGNSPLLSDESIQSIIDGLETVETSQTLTLHADVKAKLTENQIAQITSKNWTLA